MAILGVIQNNKAHRDCFQIQVIICVSPLKLGAKGSYLRAQKPWNVYKFSEILPQSPYFFSNVHLLSAYASKTCSNPFRQRELRLRPPSHPTRYHPSLSPDFTSSKPQSLSEKTLSRRQRAKEGLSRERPSHLSGEQKFQGWSDVNSCPPSCYATILFFCLFVLTSSTSGKEFRSKGARKRWKRKRSLYQHVQQKEWTHGQTSLYM